MACSLHRYVRNATSTGNPATVACLASPGQVEITAKHEEVGADRRS